MTIYVNADKPVSVIVNIDKDLSKIKRCVVNVNGKVKTLTHNIIDPSGVIYLCYSDLLEGSYIYRIFDVNDHEIDHGTIESIADADLSTITEALATKAAISGTPVNDQVAVWVNSSTLEGSANLAWDGSTLAINGNIVAQGEVSAYGGSAPASWWDAMPAPTTSKRGGIVIDNDTTHVLRGDGTWVAVVVQAATSAGFPVTGLTNALYIAQDTNYAYRWNGSSYTQVSTSLALGTTSTTAYRGDYGNTAYTERRQWDGGSTNLNATTGKTSLGLQNVTNESKATMFTNPDLTGDVDIVNTDIVGNLQEHALHMKGVFGDLVGIKYSAKDTGSGADEGVMTLQTSTDSALVDRVTIGDTGVTVIPPLNTTTFKLKNGSGTVEWYLNVGSSNELEFRDASNVLKGKLDQSGNFSVVGEVKAFLV